MRHVQQRLDIIRFRSEVKSHLFCQVWIVTGLARRHVIGQIPAVRYRDAVYPRAPLMDGLIIHYSLGGCQSSRIAFSSNYECLNIVVVAAPADLHVDARIRRRNVVLVVSSSIEALDAARVR